MRSRTSQLLRHWRSRSSQDAGDESGLPSAQPAESLMEIEAFPGDAPPAGARGRKWGQLSRSRPQHFGPGQFPLADESPCHSASGRPFAGLVAGKKPKIFTRRSSSASVSGVMVSAPCGPARCAPAPRPRAAPGPPRDIFSMVGANPLRASAAASISRSISAANVSKYRLAIRSRAKPRIALVRVSSSGTTFSTPCSTNFSSIH